MLIFKLCRQKGKKTPVSSICCIWFWTDSNVKLVFTLTVTCEIFFPACLLYYFLNSCLYLSFQVIFFLCSFQRGHIFCSTLLCKTTSFVNPSTTFNVLKSTLNYEPQSFSWQKVLIELFTAWTELLNRNFFLPLKCSFLLWLEYAETIRQAWLK